MSLNSVLGSPKTKIENAAQLIKNIVITKIIFILRIKGLIYSFNFSLNSNKFFVKRIWANISKNINKIIINFLVIPNNFESKFKPKKIACNINKMQENIPK